MVKSVKTRKNNNRKLKRRAFTRRSLLAFPPMIPFSRCFMDIVLRHVMPYSKQPINSRIDVGVSVSSLFDGPWTNLRLTFSQVKIKRVNIYAMTGCSFEDRGYHAINVAPKTEFEVTEKTSFSILLSLPGTKVNRLTRLVSGSWHPTAPDEKIWFKTDAKAALVDFVYMSSDQNSTGAATSSFPVEITVDAHVRLRGVSYVKLLDTIANISSTDTQQLCGEGSDMEFVQM